MLSIRFRRSAGPQARKAGSAFVSSSVRVVSSGAKRGSSSAVERQLEPFSGREAEREQRRESTGEILNEVKDRICSVRKAEAGVVQR
jgi:hypothetical protein